MIEPKAGFVKVDVEEEPHLVAEFKVQGIPALLLFKNGQGAGRHAGVMDYAGLRRWVEQAAG